MSVVDFGALQVCPWTGAVTAWTGQRYPMIKVAKPPAMVWLFDDYDGPTTIETRALERREIAARGADGTRWVVAVYAADMEAAVAAGVAVLERHAGHCLGHTDCLASPELARACWESRR